MSIKLPWDDYLEDAIACPVCHMKPTERFGICKPLIMCGIPCGPTYYGDYLECRCGNKSVTSGNLREVYYDWNKRVIPMIQRGEGTFCYPSDYMTQNARRIYDELVKANPEAINKDLISREDYADIEFSLPDTYKDIANYLDSLGVVIPE